MAENPENKEVKSEKTESVGDSGSQPPDFRADQLLRESKDVLSTGTEKPTSPIQANGNVQFSNIFEKEESGKDGKAEGSGNKGSAPRESSGRDLTGLPRSMSRTDLLGQRQMELGSLVDNTLLQFGRTSQSNPKTSSFGISGDLSKIDQKKPTAAFLDDTSDKVLKLDGQDLDHARISALAAQKSGYNAFVMDISKNSFDDAGKALLKAYGTGKGPGAAKAIDAARQELIKSGGDPIGLDKFDKKDVLGAATAIGDARRDLSVPLNEFAQKVKSGEIPMGKGDVLNVSLGNRAEVNAKGEKIPGTGDPTFSELSEKLGFEVNPQNLDQSKDKILQKLGEIAKDPSDPAWQKRAESALKTNKAIENVQSTGIEVVHSASNDGNDRVDINFLKANHELQSVNPESGKRDSFSGAGNRSGDGMVPIHRKEDGTQTTYSMAGKKFTPGELQTLNKDFSPRTTPPSTEAGTVSIFGAETKGKEQLDKVFSEFVNRKAPELKSAQGDLAAVAIGNSFVNVKFLQEQIDRLRAKKQDHSSTVRS